ncbi:HAD family acid phosphatase [Legionella londiniensis]|uniref:Acid phosphatase n=1 Tax=Legionella londiniensis TaxID=45068 RepID=A0A0W0VKS4_9GAMM|nr:HAD family acid phosphatase [Legionella londiniensis]KTD20700.1 acid phosphatase [Legionella londiniensis]STX92827.1 acid phosphatase, class B [Legionella londiniensis]
MPKVHLTCRAFFLYAVLIFLASPVLAEPPNLGLLTSEVKTYHDSGAYANELSCVIAKARAYLVKRAILNRQSTQPQKLALVLDIDETSISNYQKMVKRGFAASKEQINREILRADSPAIKPTLALYQEALRQGVAVFFVTGRFESQREATIKNLKSAGYQKWTNLYLRPEAYQEQSIVPFKSQARANIAKQGYTIIASIGDQCSDLTGGYAEKGFKLPNPYYYLP